MILHMLTFHSRMADLNGDGKADYIIIDDKTGAATVYINGGQNSNANLGWNWIPSGKIASGIAPGKTIQFADIDGDGKADYLSVDARGGVTAYLNGGANSQANLGWLWLPQLVRSQAVSVQEAKFVSQISTATAKQII
jgi:hypothetical protein